MTKQLLAITDGEIERRNRSRGMDVIAMEIPLTPDDLKRHLQEQVIFLRTSSLAYDKGVECEAKRLALTIRVLVNDTFNRQGKPNSVSLLTLLGCKHTITYYDVTIPRREPSPNTVLVVQLGTGLAMSPSGGFRYVPNLGPPRQKLSFDGWWNGVLISRSQEDISFTRKKIVLSIANRDGGAHIDPEIEDKYAAVLRNQAFFPQAYREGQSVKIENSPMLSAVRQVAHELEGSIREQLSRLL